MVTMTLSGYSTSPHLILALTVLHCHRVSTIASDSDSSISELIIPLRRDYHERNSNRGSDPELSDLLDHNHTNNNQDTIEIASKIIDKQGATYGGGEDDNQTTSNNTSSLARSNNQYAITSISNIIDKQDANSTVGDNQTASNSTRSLSSRKLVKLRGHRPFAEPDELILPESPPVINASLHEQAKTFGQPNGEHKKVHEILQRLNIIVSKQHVFNNSNKNGLAEEHIVVEIGRPPDAGTTIIVPDARQTPQPSSSTSRHRGDAVLLDFVHRHFSSKDYFQKRKAGRFGDGDDDSSPAVRGAEEAGRHFEGDIVLTLDQAEHMLERVVHGNDKRRKRKFIATETRRWNPDRPIEYSFDGSHTIRERNLIELALEHWQNVTCLNFQRRDDSPRGNRIVFTDVDGCASNVGRNPVQDVQFVSLASECIRLGVIAHEVAHALGFWHEQSRPDRDTFVNVKWNNIEQGSSGQFLKEKPDDVDDEGIPYDYGSIMHYRSKAFAKSDSLYTITTNVQDFQRTIGQRDQLSFNDIRLMNKVYCSHKCPQKLNCLRGGYTDPRRCDRCRCPDGFTGKLCEKIMPGYGVTCGGEVSMNSIYYYFNSPNYPQQFEEGQECSWLFRAPPGEIIEVEFVGQFELYCKIEHSLCMDYVEIRNTTDFANTGMRFCCYSAPRGRILSDTTDLLVLFRSFYRSGVGFRARARSVSYSR